MGFGGLAAQCDRIKKGLSESNSTVNLTPQSVPALCNKILFTPKIEKNIPNKMAQTRVFHLIPFPKYWRFRANFGSKDYDFKSLRLTYGLLYCLFLLTHHRQD